MSEYPSEITAEWVAGNEKAQSLLKQLEFYFSDSNLPRDDFLKKLVAAHADGAEIAVLAKFARVKQLTTDLDFIVKILRCSPQLKVNEAGTHVNRATPLPESSDYLTRTVYAKGHAADAKLDELIAFWGSHGTVKSVRMRRERGGDFKGSVFVEFATPEEAKGVVAKPPQASKDGEALIVKMKADYVAEKRELYKNRKQEDGNKRKRDHDGNDELASAAPETKEAKKEEPITKGLLVQVTGLGDTSITRPSIKEAFANVGGDPKYVEYEIGDETALIRCGGVESTAAAVAKLTETPISLSGKEPKFEILSGEVEEKEWARIRSSIQASKSRGRKH